MCRLNKIIDHLVGTGLSLQSAIPLKDLELQKQVASAIYKNPTTGKWERHEPTELQRPM
jgi:hypothetical protein